MTAPRPGRQICPVCGYDDDVEVVLADEEWVFTCRNTTHPMFEWRPKATPAGPGTYRSGIGEELGVYDELLGCIDDGFVEYGVIEHRFSVAAPEVYKELVRRYGHTTRGPSKYTASAFLGGALGQLWREELVEGRWGPATGYWKYNGQVGCYGPAGTPDDGPILSWATFASETLGAEPAEWPALGYRP